DNVSPVVTVVSPNDGATLPPNSAIQITATVTDNSGQLASVAMLWTKNGTTTTMACPASTANWSCAESGDNFTWTVHVDSGDRFYKVTATDPSGNSTTSPQQTLHLGTAPPPPRDPTTWPFTSDSPWNRPIGSGAAYDPVNGSC